MTSGFACCSQEINPSSSVYIIRDNPHFVHFEIQSRKLKANDIKGENQV
jgi:hypothetical protein